MNVGYIGLGKLGLPVALAVEEKGFQVKGVDPSSQVQETIQKKRIPYLEEGAQDLLRDSAISLVSMAELVSWADLVFVAVQTPHSEQWGGEHPVREGCDFDYGYLIGALTELSEQVEVQDKSLTVSIISTCAPGTFRKHIFSTLSPKLNYIYNPYFIAMGTTIEDFLNPEFVLLGVDDRGVPDIVLDFYQTVVGGAVPRIITDPTTAELIKMSYNTFIGQKIVFANAVMEIAEKINADANMVSYAMGLAKKRLISPAYLQGGMGDGGGCHPRDNLALWELGCQLELSHNIFRDLMMARENQTRWLAEVFLSEAQGLPLVILGEAFKPNTNLTLGSPAKLLANILAEESADVTVWDPHTTPGAKLPFIRAAYFIGTKHPEFQRYTFPHGSVVVDPWRYIPNQEGVKVIRIGERRW